MRDEMDDRLWIENHKQFGVDLAWLVDAIRVVFHKLVAIEYEAPWQVASRRGREHC